MAVYVAVLSSPSRLEKDPVIPAELADTEHGVKMGVTHVDCDDAKVTSCASANLLILFAF